MKKSFVLQTILIPDLVALNYLLSATFFKNTAELKTIPANGNIVYLLLF